MAVPQLLKVGTVLRWVAGVIGTVILSVMLWGHGYWPLCIVPTTYVFGVRLVLEQRPKPITDDDIWAWIGPPEHG